MFQTLDNNLKQALFDLNRYQGHPDRSCRDKSAVWKLAFGLQAVDALCPSKFLVRLACRHIEGIVSLQEIRQAIDTHHYPNSDAARTKEADLVSLNIVRHLGNEFKGLTVAGFLQTHRELFDDVFPFAGEIRTCNITKPERVLNGDTVSYAHFEDILPSLEYDLNQESRFRYAGLSTEAIVEHLAAFTANLWQIHAFREGNTRTVAVFLLDYLKTMNLDVHTDVLAENSAFFRDALVRSVYRNPDEHVEPDVSFLTDFFRNLVFGGNITLSPFGLAI